MQNAVHAAIGRSIYALNAVFPISMLAAIQAINAKTVRPHKELNIQTLNIFNAPKLLNMLGLNALSNKLTNKFKAPKTPAPNTAPNK